MSAKDHPNNAPGVPMVFPLWLERLQVKYINRALKPIALPTRNGHDRAPRSQVWKAIPNDCDRLPQGRCAGDRARAR